MFWSFAKFARLSLCLGGVTLTTTAWARKTNQQVYEEPFDQAAGGASLTRASQEGVMFANPALLPYGGKFHRWIGAEFSIIAAAQSVDFAKTAISGAGSSSAETEGETAESSSSSTSDLVDGIFENPIHFGATTAVSYITNNFGLGVFGRFEPDVEASKFGDTGVPEINVSAEAYSGAVMSFASRPVNWFSIGVTPKYLVVAEPNISLELTDQDRIDSLTSDPEELSAAASYGTGIGYDAGALLFLQGNWIDYRLALKVDDIGDTNFTGTQPSFKQTIHAGMGLTFHNAVDALHLSVDYRDILGAYGEEPFKRLYVGAKLLIRTYLGFGIGAYQGYPTYGIRIDFILFKLGLTAYGREMSDSPGVNPRNLYVAYMAFGI